MSYDQLNKAFKVIPQIVQNIVPINLILICLDQKLFRKLTFPNPIRAILEDFEESSEKKPTKVASIQILKIS